MKKVLQRLQMENVKVLTTPIVTHFELNVKQSPSNEVEKTYITKISYTSMVGSLIYVMVSTRLNIAHVGTINQFLSNPSREHQTDVRWISWCLHGTGDLRICFGSGKPNFMDYSNSNMVGDVDFKKPTSI